MAGFKTFKGLRRLGGVTANWAALSIPSDISGLFVCLFVFWFHKLVHVPLFKKKKKKRSGDLMHSMVIILGWPQSSFRSLSITSYGKTRTNFLANPNSWQYIVYLKIAKRVDLKCENKKEMVIMWCDGGVAKFAIYTCVKSMRRTPYTMLYVNITSIKLKKKNIQMIKIKLKVLIIPPLRYY